MEHCYRVLARETHRDVGAYRVGGEGECDSAQDAVMSDAQTTCRQCAAPVAPADRFCESCGSTLSDITRVAIPRPGTAPPGSCADCGNVHYVDDYCGVCGNRRAEPDRDEAELGGIVLVSDRGLEHARNEDAAAAGLVGPAAVTALGGGRRRVRRGLHLE